ncbi:MAG: hypothetical protein V1893_02395, partial [Candidatus Omnitrophota bacterium]
MHTHAWPAKVSKRARENLETIFKVGLVADPTVSMLLQFIPHPVPLCGTGGIPLHEPVPYGTRPKSKKPRLSFDKLRMVRRMVSGVEPLSRG